MFPVLLLVCMQMSIMRMLRQRRSSAAQLYGGIISNTPSNSNQCPRKPLSATKIIFRRGYHQTGDHSNASQRAPWVVLYIVPQYVVPCYAPPRAPYATLKAPEVTSFPQIS